jgi:hypothetical protein
VRIDSSGRRKNIYWHYLTLGSILLLIASMNYIPAAIEIILYAVVLVSTGMEIVALYKQRHSR